MNMPILYQNIMFGLPSDLARDAFLWATERAKNDPNLYGAEKFARCVHDIVAFRPIMDFAAQQHGQDKCDPDLVAFIVGRAANWALGGNIKDAYPMEATT